MLRLPKLGRRAVDPRAGIDQVDRVELVAAVVALVAARLRIPADRARPLDVPVRQRVPRGRREGDEHRLLDDRAVLVERPEQILGDALMIQRRRAREEVVREPKPLEVLPERLVVERRDLVVALPFPVRGDHHGRPVLVGSAHHQDVVALEPVVAGKRVRRDSKPRHVPQVPVPRRIRPRRRHQNLLLPSIAAANHTSGRTGPRGAGPDQHRDADHQEQQQSSERPGRSVGQRRRDMTRGFLGPRRVRSPTRAGSSGRHRPGPRRPPRGLSPPAPQPKALCDRAPAGRRCLRERVRVRSCGSHVVRRRPSRLPRCRNSCPGPDRRRIARCGLRTWRRHGPRGWPWTLENPGPLPARQRPPAPPARLRQDATPACPPGTGAAGASATGFAATGCVDPGCVDPGCVDPGRAEPGRAEPGCVEPSVADPVRVDSDVVEPGCATNGCVTTGCVTNGGAAAGCGTAGGATAGDVDAGGVEDRRCQDRLCRDRRCCDGLVEPGWVAAGGVETGGAGLRVALRRNLVARGSMERGST